MSEDTTPRKTYYVNVGFYEFKSGLVPISATDEQHARKQIMGILKDKKDIEIMDIFSEDQAPKPPEKAKFKPPALGMDQ